MPKVPHCAAHTTKPHYNPAAGELIIMAQAYGSFMRYADLTCWNISLVASAKNANILSFVSDCESVFHGDNDLLITLRNAFVENRFVMKTMTCNERIYKIPDSLGKLLHINAPSTGMTKTIYDLFLEFLRGLLIWKEPFEIDGKIGTEQLPITDPFLEFVVQLYKCAVKFAQDRWVTDKDVDELMLLTSIADKYSIREPWCKQMVKTIAKLENLLDKGTPIPMEALSVHNLELGIECFRMLGSYFPAVIAFREFYGFLTTISIPDEFIELPLYHCRNCDKLIPNYGAAPKFHSMKGCVSPNVKQVLNNADCYKPLKGSVAKSCEDNYITKYNPVNDTSFDQPLEDKVNEWYRVLVSLT